MTTQGGRLYHRDYGIPLGCPEPQEGHALVYTLHAHKEAQKDRVANVLPVCMLDHMDLIEVELNRRGEPVKWTVRMPLTKGRDLVLVVTSEYLVKTVWVNKSDDLHNTLDRTKYDRPMLVGV